MVCLSISEWMIFSLQLYSAAAGPKGAKWRVLYQLFQMGMVEREKSVDNMYVSGGSNFLKTI